MKTNEFKTLINKIEMATKGGEFTKLENKLWNEQTFLTNAQLRKALQKLFARESELGALSLSSHHTALKVLAQSLERTADKQSAKRSDEETEAQKKGDKHMSKKAEKQAVETKPETLKGEVIDTKNEKIINDAIERVSKKIENIGKGYLSIVGDVARLYDLKAWKVTGHKNIYELCADKFGMARGTVANLRSVFDRYGDRDTYKLTDECEGMSLREMLAQIASENKAALEDKNGTSEGEGEGGEGAGKKTKKVETLVNISFDLASDDWTTETILAEIKKQLDEANVEFVDGATVTFTLTK